MKKIRTRIAPSPTGVPHVGTAYMALFNYCFAAKNGGEFILRIEDTDQKRSTPESEKQILESLKWLGLKWNEGPDIGGDYGPYRQSERKYIYQHYTDLLIATKKAFKCFCSSCDLEKMRADLISKGLTSRYDGRCLNLSDSEIENKISNNEPFVVRMIVPEEGDCTFNDILRGDITVPWSQIDMQVIMKNDGLPTYFLANVVDDYLMKITHVIRGEEWLPSTPKTILLYDYFGWEKPEFCHMPLIRNIDGSKLSKRSNPTSITFYKDKGYLPEALLNYLGRMGWSMPNQEEKFNLVNMIDNFDINRISLGGPVFDVNKLTWLNGLWLREKSDYEFKEGLIDWISSNNKIDLLVPMIKTRAETYDKVVDLISFIFNSDLKFDIHSLNNILSTEENIRILECFLKKIEDLQNWNKDSIIELLKSSSIENNVKFKEIMPLIFIAITGKKDSFSVIDSMVILGSEISKYRIRKLIEFLKNKM